jgi:hypothetical protein
MFIFLSPGKCAGLLPSKHNGRKDRVVVFGTEKVQGLELDLEERQRPVL